MDKNKLKEAIETLDEVDYLDALCDYYYALGYKAKSIMNENPSSIEKMRAESFKILRNVRKEINK